MWDEGCRTYKPLGRKDHNGLSANIAGPLSGWAAHHSAAGGLASSVSRVTPFEAERFILTNNNREDAFLPSIFRNVVPSAIPVCKIEQSTEKTQVALQFSLNENVSHTDGEEKWYCHVLKGYSKTLSVKNKASLLQIK